MWEDFAETYRACFPDSRPWTVDEFQDLSVHPFTYIFGSSSAFMVVRSVLDEAEILTIATHPRVQRQGRGATLIRTACQTLLKDGVAKMFLEVAADNLPAKKLYARYGFETVAIRKGYYARSGRKAVDALVMEKGITDN